LRASVCLGVNIGLATYPEDGTTTDELLSAADTRMYQAKAQGFSVLA
jgi:GGDEF domain-containing protein